ncbi:MAG: hypothetical protein KF825_10235 [Ferruginibacter sp.]|nr:hypothetical protein [Ferruginibacter sp.]
MVLFYTKNKILHKKSDYLYWAFTPKEAALNFLIKPNVIEHTTPVFSIGENYYSNNLGFFCKKEWQFEKATKIPFRFRLGSLQYNDYLEQKPNAVKQY